MGATDDRGLSSVSVTAAGARPSAREVSAGRAASDASQDHEPLTAAAGGSAVAGDFHGGAPPASAEDSQDIGAIGRTLASVQLRVPPRRLYIDVKRNVRGLFLKLVESHASGERCKLIVPAPGLQLFVDALTQLRDEAAGDVATGADGTPAPTTPSAPVDDQEPAGGKSFTTTLHTRSFRMGQRRFFVDVVRNPRGRFVKLSQRSPTQKSNVLVPADCLPALTAAVIDVFRQAGVHNLEGEREESNEDSGEANADGGGGFAEDGVAASAGGAGELQARQLRVEGKVFLLEPAVNQRGTYLSIVELRRHGGGVVADGPSSSARVRINVPLGGWCALRDALSEYIRDADGAAKANRTPAVESAQSPRP